MSDETDTTSEVARVLGEHTIEAVEITPQGDYLVCTRCGGLAMGITGPQHQAAMLAEGGLLRDERDSAEPCDSEVWSMDYYRDGQVDPYWIRCNTIGPHVEHEDANTGLTWTTDDPEEAQIAAPVPADCGSCAACDPGVFFAGERLPFASRMSVCPDCGNKRCPKAANHVKWECSGSNAVGQEGVPVPAVEARDGSAGRGESGGLGERLREAAESVEIASHGGLWAMADEADELEAAYRVADAEIARLSEFHDHYRAQVDRVQQVADMAAVLATDGRGTPYERALAGRFDETIRVALDGPGDALLERIGRVLDEQTNDAEEGA